MADDFARQVGRFSEETTRKLSEVVRKVSLDAFSDVIRMSPVDSGRFKGNWMVAVNSTPAGYVWEQYDPSGGATIAEAAGRVEGAEAGDVVVMANNLPYAQRLEYGWSGQAPSGMVRVTAARWQPIVDRVVAQVARG